MFEFLALFAFTISGLVGVLLIAWWWADGRDENGSEDDAEPQPSPSLSTSPKQ